MKQDSLLPRQKLAFSFCAFSAPAVAAASHLPWPWVLGLTALASVLWCLPQGSGEGKTLRFLQAGFAAVLLWQFALGSASAFPDDAAHPFVPLTLLAVSTWAACQGKAACVRALGVGFFFLAALYGIVFFSAISAMDGSRITLKPQTRDIMPFAVALLLPFYGSAFSADEKGKTQLGWRLGFLLLPTAAALFCTLVPGSQGKFYTMVKSIELFSFAQRMEPLVSVATTLGWFSALCLLQLFIGDRFPQNRSTAIIFSGAAAAVGVAWGRTVSPTILLLFGAVFCVLFPLLTQVLVPVKKSSKKVKKGVDKGGKGW